MFIKGGNMKENVQKVIKIEMGYCEDVCNCSTCYYYVEEAGYDDRSWVDMCTFNTIGKIDVKKTASCNYWKQKITTSKTGV